MNPTADSRLPLGLKGRFHMNCVVTGTEGTEEPPLDQHHPTLHEPYEAMCRETLARFSLMTAPEAGLLLNEIQPQMDRRLI